jgi:glycosyltransferase involved in cell wall biosynthesis
MKILFVCSWPPYPCLSGGRRRTAQLIRSLKQNHEVRVVSFVGGPTERKLMEDRGAIAVPYQQEARKNALPPSLWPFDSPLMRERLMELAEEGYQLTLFDQIFVSSFLPQAVGRSVLLEQNVESSLLKQRAQYLEPDKKRLAFAQFMAMKAYENKIWPQFDLRCAVSEQDAQEMRSRCPSSETVVVPNGVDPKRAYKLDLTDQARLLFVGALDYWPNEDAANWLCDEIMPRVWSEIPHMKLRIVGRNPSGELQQRVLGYSRIELLANAPELEPLAAECAMSVVPLRMGSGTRLKILEAGAWGLPVVTTSIGCEGLSQSLCRHLTEADGCDDFASAILSLWDNPAERAELAERARAEVVRDYSWSVVFRPLHRALEALVQ